MTSDELKDAVDGLLIRALKEPHHEKACLFEIASVVVRSLVDIADAQQRIAVTLEQDTKAAIEAAAQTKAEAITEKQKKETIKRSFIGQNRA